MIDLTKLKTPGWSQVVAELSAPAPDDRVFLSKLTSILGQVSAGRQAVLFAVPAANEQDAEPEPRELLRWAPPASAEQATTEPHAAIITNAARAAATDAQVRVFGTEKQDGFYDSSPKGFIVATPIALKSFGELTKVVVVLTLDHRSQQALQTTLAIIEIIAGYAGGHDARRQLQLARASGVALDLAASLIAAINNAKGFKGATLTLVNELSRKIGADRVAFGWVKSVGESGAVRLVALSDTENVDRRTNLSQKIEAAMDECLDQIQPVMYPVPQEGTDALLGVAITHAHRELVSSDAGLRVASFPLRAGGKVHGVVTVEASDAASLTVESVEQLQATLDLLAPVMAIRWSDDRPLPMRAARSARAAAAWAIGPTHTGWKLAGLTAFVIVLCLVFIRVPYRVEAKMEIQPRVERVVSMPFDGIIRALGDGVRPGAEVKVGQVLVHLDSDVLALRADSERQSVIQYKTQADAARTERKLADAEQAEAKARQSEANLRLLEFQISQSTILSPIDGTIIEGDLESRVGSTMSLGDTMFRIATLDTVWVVAQLRDEDIRLVQERHSTDQPVTGYCATKADPSRAIPLRVERIVPLAKPDEGGNAFLIKASLVGDAALLPGIEGVAKFDTGERALIDILTRRIRDRIRLWTWW